MNRRTVLLGFLISALVINQVSASDHADSGKRHYESEGGFSYLVPPDWEVSEFPGMKYKMLRPADSNAGANLVIADEKYAGHLSKYVDVTVMVSRSLNPKLRVLSKHPFATRYGEAGFKIVVENVTPAGVPIRQAMYLFVHEGRAFTIVASTKAEFHDRFDAQYDSILETVSFDSSLMPYEKKTQTGSATDQAVGMIVELFRSISANDSSMVSEIVAKEPELANAKDPDGLTPLYVAAAAGQTSIVEILIRNGSDVNCAVKALGGFTPLYIAAQKGHLAVVANLLESGAQPNVRDKSMGATALHVAADQGHLKIAEILLKKGAEIDAKAISSGVTPLFIAAQAGQKDVVGLLIERGADVNARSGKGVTAIYIAAQKGHKEIVEILLSKGADPNIKSADGASPLWIAMKMGHVAIERLLKEHGAKQ
jgi:ankyrin repeat protein